MIHIITEEQLKQLKYISDVCSGASKFIYGRLDERDGPIDCNLRWINDVGKQLSNIYKQIQEQKEA